MSVINGKILQSNFELIRDRIGAILADEFVNQATYGDTDIAELKVWVSRTVPFDKTDMPAINVNYVHGDFFSKDAQADTNTYKYSIDCQHSGKSGINGDKGDAKAMMRMQKIMGIASRILGDTKYRTLGFAPPSIQQRYFETADIADVSRNDADSLMFGRLIFVVRINEETNLFNAPLLKGYDTQVKLDLTNEGYFYKVNEYA
jgi:hypothetical protein